MLQALRSPRSPVSTARSSGGSASTAPSTPAGSASSSQPALRRPRRPITEDPDRAYREKAAYAYFLRRGLDLLAPNGLGVFLVPSGFLSGPRDRADHAPREGAQAAPPRPRSAYRLPSAIFPGAMLVTDLLFFRARGGELAEVDEADRFILDGDWFREFPTHILGTEVGKDAGDDDQTAKPRWGYQVVGDLRAAAGPRRAARSAAPA
jgi:hypothetical protein